MSIAPQVFAQRNLAELFPTPIWIFDLRPEETARCNTALLRHLDSIASPRPPQKNDLSLQSEHDLQRHACFAPLRPKVDLAVREIMRHLDVSDGEPMITGAWLNLSPPGVRHHDHTHPNNWLSLVYYVQVPKGGDNIRFYDPRPQAQVLMPRTRRLSRLTGGAMTIGVVSGRLLAFPSWLRHSVDPNAGEGERVSVAVNVMFKEFGERMAAPMWDAKLKA